MSRLETLNATALFTVEFTNGRWIPLAVVLGAPLRAKRKALIVSAVVAFAKVYTRRLQKAGHIVNSQRLVPPSREWRQNCDDDCRYWDTSCGRAFTFIDGSPSDNELHFCCYCGKTLECAGWTPKEEA